MELQRGKSRKVNTLKIYSYQFEEVDNCKCFGMQANNSMYRNGKSSNSERF